jgi:hypothetical protein
MIDFRLLISNEAVTTVKESNIQENYQGGGRGKSRKNGSVNDHINMSNITTTERMKLPHICSRDILFNNQKDMFLLSTSTLWPEASTQNTWVVYQQHQTSASSVGGVVGLSF